MHRRAMPPLRMLLAALVLWPLLAAPCAVTGHLSLTAQPGWQLDNSAGFGNISLSGLRLPASVPQLLHRAGVVGDPLYRYNELQQRWVALDTWTLSLWFQAPPDLLRHRAVLLRCDGLDMVASIQLNGAPLALTANAHRHHTFNVTHLLVPGANVLNITLLPAPRYAAEQAAAYPYEVPATQQVGAIPGYNFVRKAASDFGWDWGPALAPAGINGGIQLLGHSRALLDGIAVRQQHLVNGSVLLAVDAFLLPVQAPALEVQQQQQQQLQGNQLARAGERGRLLLQLTSPDGLQHWQAESAVSISYFDSHTSECDAMANCSCCSGRRADSACPWLLPGAGGAELTAFAAQAAAQPVQRSLSILLDSPRLWWPHDFGSQPLYSLRLTYLPNSPDRSGSAGRTRAGQRSGSISNTEQQQPNGQLRFAAAAAGVDEAVAEAEEAASATHSSTVTRRIGLRTVQLVTDPLPDGETFYFRVNGQPVYVRGANAVPAHVFEPAVSDALLHRLVADAKAARMNMLRVWGGGRYFKDAFYEACDEQGVLVWQEAMFACAMYPRDQAFLREAWLEVRQQARRLSSHPSVAIWGGNNENEAAFQWFPAPSRNPKLYASDYSKLFVDVVRQAVLGVDPGIPFVDSSPSNGVLSREPYVKRWGDVADPRYGDVHFYDYSSDAWDPATYPAAKFVSEFGFMSLPSFSAYRQVTEPRDWRPGAPMTAFRMRHAGGLEQLQQQMERHFLLAPQGVGESGPQPAASSGEQQQQAPQPQLEQQAQQAQQAQRLNGGAGLLSLHPNGSLKRRAVPAQPADPDPQGQEQRQFEAFTYLSQLQQALAYQAAIHQWRRNKADPTARTMGVLFWQLNDVWQGPSWSALNSDGSWRLAQHFAAEFYKPVLVSGVKVGRTVQVHLTNDLPVHVTGLLAVDIVPYAATDPSHIAALIRLNVTIAAFDSRMVWSGSVAGDILTATGLVPHLQQDQQQAWQGNDTAPGSSSGSDSGSGGSSGSSGSGIGSRGGNGGRRRVEAADVFLRLRFCPTAVQRQQAAAGITVPPPEPFKHNLIKLGGLVEGALHGGSDTAADGQAGAHSGGSASIAPPCDAAVALLDGAAADRCEAAGRLLQCSESLELLTEPKAARMAPANVSIQLTHGGRQQQDADGLYLATPADGGGTGVLAVSLRSDAVALFVAVENSARAGHFVGSGTLLLLPWQPQTLRFQEAVHPAEHREEGLGNISVYWLQREMAALQSAMWLTEGAAHAAAARAAWFIAGFASVLLVALGVCGWVKHAR